jgi:hypothetical protein
MDKYIKDKALCEEIQTKICSVLYLFYTEEIFSESFIIARLRNKEIEAKNAFYNEKSENEFIEKSEEFLKWLETAPYEEE